MGKFDQVAWRVGQSVSCTESTEEKGWAAPAGYDTEVSNEPKNLLSHVLSL